MGSGGHRGTGGRPSTRNPPFWKIIAMGLILFGYCYVLFLILDYLDRWIHG